jgi:hypothetical protein
MLFCDRDLPYLRLHLPVYANACDGFVGLTDMTTSAETVALVQSFGARTFRHDWQDNWSYSLNILIQRCEECGFDAMLRLDPDEAIFPASAQVIKQVLERDCTLLFLSRWNFWMDRKHYSAANYPNYVHKAFRLNRGIRWILKRHETMNLQELGLTVDLNASPDVRAMSIPDPQVFHYGWLKPNLAEKELRYINYHRRDDGLSELDVHPGPVSQEYVSFQDVQEFTLPQPIDPDVCGIYAPWEGE